jgi:heptosyltransferase I
MFQPNHILIIKPSSLGDIVNGLPVLAALKRHWPDAGVDWVVKREWSELLTGHPMVGRVIFFPRTVAEGLAAWRQRRSHSYDMVIDLQGLLRSGLYAAMTGCRVRVGFCDGREGSSWFYTHRIKVAKNAVHAVDRCLDLVRQLGVTLGPPAQFPLPDGRAEQNWLEDLWRRYQILEKETVCVIHPAARWATKRWPVSRFAQLADELVARERFRVVIVGNTPPIGQFEEITHLMKHPAINLVGKTSLLQLAALLRRSDLLVTNDSGPMHLAAAVGTPVVAIFGPTDPRRVGPYGTGHVVLRKDVDCSRCTRRACVRDGACLKAIDVDEVHEAVRSEARSGMSPASARVFP